MYPIRILLLAIMCCGSQLAVQAQSAAISGRLIDIQDRQFLAGASLLLLDAGTSIAATSSNADGSFSIPLPTAHISSKYLLLEIRYLGYHTLRLPLNASVLTLGDVLLSPQAKRLEEVSIRGKRMQSEVRGDTLAYLAEAFQTLPGADADQLIEKLPGLQLDGKNITAMGEQVKEVLLDGKPFFSGNPMAALQLLPAHLIKKVELYEKLSEEAELSGIDDGRSIWVLNIISKPELYHSVFGKTSAGVGTQDRYQVQGNLNHFDGDTRLSLMGMSNNINQAPFLESEAAASAGKRKGGGGRRATGEKKPTSAGSSPASATDGITQTHALGGNYSDSWKGGWQIDGSYLYHQYTLQQQTDLLRTYLTGNIPDYREESRQEKPLSSHLLELRIERKLQNKGALWFKPSIRLESGSFSSDLLGYFPSTADRAQSWQQGNISRQEAGMETGLRQRLSKPGRTISYSISGKAIRENQPTELYAYTLSGNKADSLQQQQTSKGRSVDWRGSVSYTEPLGKSLLLLRYQGGYTDATSTAYTYHVSAVPEEDALLDSTLSASLQSGYLTQQLGSSLRIGNRQQGFNLSMGVQAQWAQLQAWHLFPYPSSRNMHFLTCFPQPCCATSYQPAVP